LLRFAPCFGVLEGLKKGFLNDRLEPLSDTISAAMIFVVVAA